MTTPDQQALAMAKGPDGEVDEEVYLAERDRLLAERNRRLRSAATASSRAMTGWRTVETQEAWLQTFDQAREDFASGEFLIDRLGAKRHVDPTLTAVLLSLRQTLIDDHDATTAAEYMIIDSAVLSYYHQLRVNGWIGDLAQELEKELFGNRPLTANVDNRTSEIRGLRVEDIVSKLGEKLLPMTDRLNRMMLRNLKAAGS